jgi:hypothetical protein
VQVLTREDRRNFFWTKGFMGCLTWVSTWSSFVTQICDFRPEGIMENIFATHDFSSDLICCSFTSGVHFREREDDGREWLRGIFGIGSRSGQQVFFSVKTQWQVTRPNCNTGPTASKKERLICTGPKGAEIFCTGPYRAGCASQFLTQKTWWRQSTEI